MVHVHYISVQEHLNKLSLVSTVCHNLWSKTANGVNYLASPSSLRPCVQLTANLSSWQWVNILHHGHKLTLVLLWLMNTWCEYIFLQGYNEWNNNIVEQWNGSNRKQSYSYLIQSNSTVTFAWTFQRTEKFNMVRNSNYNIIFQKF